jgi:hypothetical protein
MYEMTAEPLARLGSLRIKEKAGSNIAGPVATSAALIAFWDELIAYCTATPGWGLRRIEVKSAEAVAALLHEIVAPGAGFLCGRGCPHVLCGADADQVKRFLDSLDQAVMMLRRAWHGCAADGPLVDDLQAEFNVYEDWRLRFADWIAVPSESRDPPWRS